MNLNLENFNIRRSIPYIAGTLGLAPGTERYTAKAQGLIGIESFEGDYISIKNTHFDTRHNNSFLIIFSNKFSFLISLIIPNK